MVRCTRGMHGISGRENCPSTARVKPLYLGPKSQDPPHDSSSDCCPCRRRDRRPGARAGPPRPGFAARIAHVLCAGGAEGGAFGGQCLCRQDRRDAAQPVHGRSVLPPLFRRWQRRHAARAGSACAWLRRDCGRQRIDHDQQSRHRRRQRSEGRAVRQARIRGRGAAQGCAHRSRRAARQGRAREIHRDRSRQFGRAAGGRRRARARQSVRRRADCDARHRLGACAHAGRHHGLSVLHPDRCGDQSGQFGRRAGRSCRAPRRPQHGDLLALGRLAGHRLCDPGQHGQGGDRLGQEAAARP